MRAIIGAEGEATVETAAGTIVLPPHHLVMYRGTEPLTTTCAASWSRFYWNIEAPLLLQPRFDDMVGTPIALNDLYWHLISSTTNVLTSTEKREDPGYSLLSEGIGATLAAAVMSTMGPADAEPYLGKSSLYIKAIQMIDERHRDPLLTVSTLARELAVSESYLHRAFSLEGTTPGQEIEQRRTITAQTLNKTIPGYTLQDIANNSGFTSIKRLRHAQRRQRVIETPRP